MFQKKKFSRNMNDDRPLVSWNGPQRSCSVISAAWRNGNDEQIVLEYVLFESENQHQRALQQMLEAERRAKVAVVALRKAEKELDKICDLHEEEVRRWGRHYSESEIDMDLSVEKAENILVQVNTIFNQSYAQSPF
jgi:hypothetical protein